MNYLNEYEPSKYANLSLRCDSGISDDFKSEELKSEVDNLYLQLQEIKKLTDQSISNQHYSNVNNIVYDIYSNVDKPLHFHKTKSRCCKANNLEPQSEVLEKSYSSDLDFEPNEPQRITKDKKFDFLVTTEAQVNEEISVYHQIKENVEQFFDNPSVYQYYKSQAKLRNHDDIWSDRKAVLFQKYFQRQYLDSLLDEEIPKKSLQANNKSNLQARVIPLRESKIVKEIKFAKNIESKKISFNPFRASEVRTPLTFDQNVPLKKPDKKDSVQFKKLKNNPVKSKPSREIPRNTPEMEDKMKSILDKMVRSRQALMNRDELLRVIDSQTKRNLVPEPVQPTIETENVPIPGPSRCENVLDQSISHDFITTSSPLQNEFNDGENSSNLSDGEWLVRRRSEGEVNEYDWNKINEQILANNTDVGISQSTDITDVITNPSTTATDLTISLGEVNLLIKFDEVSNIQHLQLPSCEPIYNAMILKQTLLKEYKKLGKDDRKVLKEMLQAKREEIQRCKLSRLNERIRSDQSEGEIDRPKEICRIDKMVQIESDLEKEISSINLDTIKVENDDESMSKTDSGTLKSLIEIPHDASPRERVSIRSKSPILDQIQIRDQTPEKQTKSVEEMNISPIIGIQERTNQELTPEDEDIVRETLRLLELDQKEMDKLENKKGIDETKVLKGKDTRDQTKDKTSISDHDLSEFFIDQKKTIKGDEKTIQVDKENSTPRSTVSDHDLSKYLRELNQENKDILITDEDNPVNNDKTLVNEDQSTLTSVLFEKRDNSNDSLSVENTESVSIKILSFDEGDSLPKPE